MENELKTFKNLCSESEKQLADMLTTVEELKQKYLAVPLYRYANTNEDVYNDWVEPFEHLKTALRVAIESAQRAATFADEKINEYEQQ